MTITSAYMNGRKKWSRPQAMVWCDKAPTLDIDGKFIPVGYEIGSNVLPKENESFIVLSDHNRAEISMSNERIEQRQRMANGTMRSFFIADKISINTSWSMLPSRSFKDYPSFRNTDNDPSPTVDSSGKPQLVAEPFKPGPTVFSAQPYGSKFYPEEQYTVDGGAGGGEMLDWYESHTGPFWVLLSYDKYANFSDGTIAGNNLARQKLGQYSEAKQMYISNFSYSIVKRGGNNFDMWNVSVTLEEV